MPDSTVTTLAPRTSAKERKAIKLIISKVVREASREYFGNDLMEHVYCAGLWHGAELAERSADAQP